MVTTGDGTARAWAAVDRLDGLVAVGIGLVRYGLTQLYSVAHAAVTVGVVLLIFAVIGLTWQIRHAMRRVE